MKNIIEDVIAGKISAKSVKKQMDEDPALKEKLKKQFKAALNKRGEKIKQLEKEVSLKVQLSEVSKALSMSYIAKEYFGKSKEWLYHRINGAVVNGKPAQFTPEQKKQFNSALKDISKKIGSVAIS